MKMRKTREIRIATMGADGKPSDDALPTVVEHVWDAFGPEHVLFGSDWPVCLKARLSYRQVLALTQHVLPTLTAHETDAVFGGNAVQCYGLSDL